MKKIYLIVLTIAVFSCKEKTAIKKKNYKLSISDTLSFKLSMNDYYVSRNNQVIYFNDTTYVFRENFMNNRLDIINWTTKEKKTLKYNIEGKNGVGHLNGSAYYPLKKDSIIFANINGRIYLTKKNEVIKSYTIKNNNIIPQFNGIKFNNCIKYKNSLIISVGSPYRIEDKRIYSRKIFYNFNLKNQKKSKYLPITYPTYLKNNCWARESLRFGAIKNDKNELLITFSNIDSLYIYNLEDFNLTNTIAVKSQFMGKIEPYNSCDYTNIEKYKFYVDHSFRYFGIIYNKYKKLYYQIVLLPSIEKKPKRGYYKGRPFIIIVLDKNFKTIAERKFKAGKYLIIDSFITKEGLWISNNNPLNPNFDENKLSFSLFKLEKND